MELKQKVTLAQKGQSVELKKKTDLTETFHATLRWKAAVDLDLHCFYSLKSAGQASQPTGFFGKIKAALTTTPTSGHVHFANKGQRNSAPWIVLDQDAGVGDVGGDNEENMHFFDIDKIEHALICANIYGKPNSNFASYDGRVIVQAAGREFEVPLTETQTGSWCVVARINNSTGTPQLINVNRTQRAEPRIEEFL